MDQAKVVVFELDKKEYAAPIGSVREVVNVTDATPIPDSPEYILGVINLRGMVIPVVSLDKRLKSGREGSPNYKHILIAEDEKGNLFGLKIDRVIEVLSVPQSAIQPALRSKIGAEYLKGVVVLSPQLSAEQSSQLESSSYQNIVEQSQKAKSRIIMLLDISKILSVNSQAIAKTEDKGFNTKITI